MTTKDFRIYLLIFLGFLLLVLPMWGISVFQVGPWWWIYNIVLLMFGALLMQVAIDLKSPRWAMLGGFIFTIAIILFFVVGKYFAAQGGLKSGG